MYRFSNPLADPPDYVFSFLAGALIIGTSDYWQHNQRGRSKKRQNTLHINGSKLGPRMDLRAFQLLPFTLAWAETGLSHLRRPLWGGFGLVPRPREDNAPGAAVPINQPLGCSAGLPDQPPSFLKDCVRTRFHS